MRLLTVLQFSETLLAYLFVTLAIPCAVLGKKFSHYRFAKRTMIYFIIGNFYATNLVFLLELLHLSNFFTIWFGLIVVPAIVWGILYDYPLNEKLDSLRYSSRKLVSGSMGIKSVMNGIWRMLRWRISKAGKSAKANFKRNWIDLLLIAAMLMMVMWIYGVRMVRSYGYSASDMPVHLFWVN